MKKASKKDKTTRISIDLQGWMLDALDREASRIGIPRQALLKLWISAMIEDKRREAAAVPGKPA